MAWHLAGLDVVHGATRRPPDVSAHGLQSAQRGRCARGGALRHRAHRQAHARDLARRGDAAQPLRAGRPLAGGIRGRPSARCTLGAGRAAGAGNRLAHGDLGRPRRAGRRQRRSRDHDRVVAEADGLAGRCGAGRRSGRWRLGHRAACAARPRPRSGLGAGYRCDGPARPVGGRQGDGDRSRPEQALRAGPYSRRLVCDPIAARRCVGEAARRSADRADLVRRRAGAAGGGRAAGRRVRSGDDP